MRRVFLALLVATGVSGLAAIAADAHPAQAAAVTPTSGCWGTCGGDFGPKPAAIFVEKKRLSGFDVTDACLGQRSVEGPLGEKVKENKQVSWSTLGTKVGEAPKPGIPIVGGKVTTTRNVSVDGTGPKVLVKLQLEWVTASKVKGTLTIHHGSCRAFSFTVHKAG